MVEEWKCGGGGDCGGDGGGACGAGLEVWIRSR